MTVHNNCIIYVSLRSRWGLIMSFKKKRLIYDIAPECALWPISQASGVLGVLAINSYTISRLKENWSHMTEIDIYDRVLTLNMS